MQCNYCGKQVYISHICPHCGEHYCLEHRYPLAHDCPSYNRTTARKPKAKREHIKNAKTHPQANRAQDRVVTHIMIQQETKASDLKPAPSEAYMPQIPAKEIIRKEKTYTITLESFGKRLFAASFILVLMEEVLRLVSYLTNPPLLTYLDGNIVVRTLNQYVGNPLIASLLTFAAVCLLLFITRKLTSRNQSIDNPSIKPFAGATLIIVFTTIAITYIIAIIEWIFILTE